MKFKQSQRGIGLLELMLSLAIIAILLVMATRYFASARQGQEVASAISTIQAVSAASQSYFVAQGNSWSGLTSVTKLVAGGYLPSNASTTGPWGGAIMVTGGADSSNPTAVRITIPNVPPAACTQLNGVLKSQIIVTGGVNSGGLALPTCASTGNYQIEI